MAHTLAVNYTYGTWLHTVEGSNSTNPNYTLLTQELRVGDIISSGLHVMICLGKCDDGSFIILHSFPSQSKTGKPGGGVQISPVNVKEEYSKDCEAYRLCEKYIKYFKKWTDRYTIELFSPQIVFNFSDLVPETGIFHWNLENGTMTDPDNYSSKSAEEILNDLFNDSSGESTIKVIIIIIIVLFVLLLIIVLTIVLIKKKKDKDKENEENMNRANEQSQLISKTENNE